MSRARTSHNSKHKKSETKFQQQIATLEQRIVSPPQNYTKSWLKQVNEEQKSLFEEVRQLDFTGKTQSLKQLTEIGRKIKLMKQKLKSISESFKTPASQKSRKSTKSKKSQSRKELSQQSLTRSQVRNPKQSNSRSKSSKKEKITKKSYHTQNTPKFQKKKFENKLGSFSKDFINKQKESQRGNARMSSRLSKNQADRSESISRSRSTSSKKQQSRLKKRAYSESNESSSIALSSDLKEAVNLRMNKVPVTTKYEALMSNEKVSQDLEVGKLSREENLMLTTKLESVTKEKLLREYRILYYRSKEVRKLLTEYYEQNLTLNDEKELLKQQLEEKEYDIKQYKKELKLKTKEYKQMHSEYSTKLDQLGKSYQQYEINTVPLTDYEIIKVDNEKLLVENEMLKEEYKMLTQKLTQIENDLMQKRSYEIPEQEISQRLQREVETIREQYDRTREENMKLKFQLDKETLTNRELSQQIHLKKNEQEGTVEQKHYEVSSIKSHLQTANNRIQKLEQQLNQMKYSLIAEQESNFSIKEKIIRQEEELRISHLKVENREKEISEYKTSELILKKRILDLESKVENQFQNTNPYFETTMHVQKTTGIESIVQKELQVERQFLAKTQEEFLSLQREHESQKRYLKQLELELQYEKSQSDSLRQRLSQAQCEQEVTLQRIQQQFEEKENNKQKELAHSEQQQKNQENVIHNAQQRITEFENELKRLNNKGEEEKNEISQQKLQIERLLLKLESNESKLSEFSREIQRLEGINEELIETNKQLRMLNQQINKELDQIDRMKENYKNKYLNNRYESKKIINQYNEKENVMKQTYTSELERIKSEKEQLEKLKNQDECSRNQKDKKLKVINDLQQMIKGHKKTLDK